MSSSSEKIQDDSASGQGASGREQQQHAGSSGEGAASALAQLKHQHRQHRRQIIEPEDNTGEGPGE